MITSAHLTTHLANFKNPITNASMSKVNRAADFGGDEDTILWIDTNGVRGQTQYGTAFNQNSGKAGQTH